MLLCKQVCCCWYLVYIDCAPDKTVILTVSEKELTMSKTATVALAPSSSVFARLLAVIDRLLMASAKVSNRNGDLPYFGM